MTGGAQPQLTREVLNTISKKIPFLPENPPLVHFFRRWMTCLLPIGLANYQSFKLAVLSKMFPKNRQNLPEIRLVGFQGGWKERRLKDLVEQVTRKNSAFDLDNVLIISAQYELINQEDFLMITCKNKCNLCYNSFLSTANAVLSPKHLRGR